MGKAAHGVDGLVSEVVLSAGVVFNQLENNNFILLLLSKLVVSPYKVRNLIMENFPKAIGLWSMGVAMLRQSDSHRGKSDL